MKKIILPLEFIEQLGQKIHVFTYIKISRKKLRMIVDTGASQSIIAKHIQKKYSLKTYHNIQHISAIGVAPANLKFHVVIIPKLMINDMHIHNFPCLCMSFEHINKTYKTIGEKPVDGIIGMDILSLFNARILFDEKYLVLNVTKKSISLLNSLNKIFETVQN